MNLDFRPQLAQPTDSQIHDVNLFDLGGPVSAPEHKKSDDLLNFDVIPAEKPSPPPLKPKEEEEFTLF